MKKILGLLSIAALLVTLMSCQPAVGSDPAGEDVLTLTAVNTPLGVQIVASYDGGRSIASTSRSLAAQPAGVTFTSYDDDVATLPDESVVYGTTIAAVSETSGLVTPIDNQETASITVVAVDSYGATTSISVDLNPVALANGTNAVPNPVLSSQTAVMWKFDPAAITGLIDDSGTGLVGGITGATIEDKIAALEAIRFVWIANCPPGTLINPSDSTEAAAGSLSGAYLTTKTGETRDPLETHYDLSKKLNAGIVYLADIIGDPYFSDAEPWVVIDGVYTSPGGGDFSYTTDGTTLTITAADTAAISGNGGSVTYSVKGLKATLISVSMTDALKDTIQWDGDLTP